MKEKAEDININEEYEKLVPTTERKSLFDDSEDYQSLREYIMAQPYNTLKKSKLPFAGIELLSYIDFRWQQAVDKATDERKHLFFIKQSEKGQAEFCNAAGYYEKKTKNFVVLPYSYIVSQAYGAFMPYSILRNGNRNMDGNNRYVTFPVILDDPEQAATFVLGQKAGLDEWVDRRGKGLLDYYPELTVKEVVSTENDLPFAPVSAPPVEKHIFHITVKGVCRASGYYDPIKGHFYILKDSFLALKADPEYEKSASGIARNRMLASVCTSNAHYYIVSKDTKCRSASAAACYVLGRESDLNSWKDSDGRLLHDVYPNVFSKPIENKQPKKEIKHPEEPIKKQKVKQGRPPRYYYIIREGIAGRSCNAKGEYDKINDKFIILAGSELSHEVSRAYRFSASDIKRKKFIQQYCGPARTYSGITLSDYKLKKDGICNSPDEAACFVLGEAADGWKEWKSKDGISLEGYINKI